MSQELFKTEADRDEKPIPDLPEPSLPDGSSLIGLLVVAQVLMGVVCIIAGGIAASKSYSDGVSYAIGGIVSGVFMFTLAVVTAACRKYLSK